jgi:hypothetical protein
MNGVADTKWIFYLERRGADMKFARFEVRMSYLLTSQQEGWQINSLCNPGTDAVRPLFSALESSFIYMPVNDQELVAAGRAEFARTGVPSPPNFFSAPIQYFVNSQLHYTANRAIAGRWPVEKEVRYSATSKHTADVRIAVSVDKYADLYHEPFNIWIESDHARDARVLYKNLQKVLVALGSRTDGHDVFVQFLYRTKDFQKLNSLAAALRRSFDVARRSLGARISFVIAHIAPSHLSAHEILDSELVLFRGTSLRVNDCYFHGWTRSGDFWLLNERVKKTDDQR